MTQLPFSPSTKPDSVIVFDVKRRQLSSIYLTNSKNNFESISEGSVLDLFDQRNQIAGMAVVSEIVDEVIFARIVVDNAGIYKFATLKNWWEPQYINEEVFSEEVFTNEPDKICTLNVQCLIPADHKAGFIGWTLFAQLRSEESLEEFQEHLLPIVQGNDREERGKLLFQHTGKWKPGNYYLRAKRYSTVQLITLQEVDVSWSINEDSLKLSYGNLSDVTPPLNLR